MVNFEVLGHLGLGTQGSPFYLGPSCRNDPAKESGSGRKVASCLGRALESRGQSADYNLRPILISGTKVPVER